MGPVRRFGPLVASLPRPSSQQMLCSVTDLREIEQRLRELVVATPERGRAEILRILSIRDHAERAREMGNLHRSGVLPATTELLIDAEEDPALRAVLVGILRESQP
jgi:hypothetical protein